MKLCVYALLLTTVLLGTSALAQKPSRGGYSEIGGSGGIGEGTRLFGTGPVRLDFNGLGSTDKNWGIAFLLNPSGKDSNVAFAIILIKEGLKFEEENFTYAFETLEDHKTVRCLIKYVKRGSEQPIILSTSLTTDWNQQIELDSEGQKTVFNVANGRFFFLDSETGKVFQEDLSDFKVPKTTMFGLLRKNLAPEVEAKISELISKLKQK